MTNDATVPPATADAFLDRLDAFAKQLSGDEQQMLRVLIGDDDDTAGFKSDVDWPGVRNVVSPLKLGVMSGPISNGDLGSGRIMSGPISNGDLGSGRVVSGPIP